MIEGAFMMKGNFAEKKMKKNDWEGGERIEDSLEGKGEINNNKL